MSELAIKEKQFFAVDYNKVPHLDGFKEYSKRDITCFDVPGHVKSNGVKILNDYFGEQIMDINSSPLIDYVSGAYGIIKD